MQLNRLSNVACFRVVLVGFLSVSLICIQESTHSADIQDGGYEYLLCRRSSDEGQHASSLTGQPCP